MVHPLFIKGTSMKYWILSIIIFHMMVILSSCEERSQYHAEYAPVDSIPYNVETNVETITEITGRYPGSYTFRSNYPQYDATVAYGMVSIPDSNAINKVLRISFDRMSNRIGSYEADIRTYRPDSNLIGWIMVTPQSEAPVMMMVTDSANVVLHATMNFNSTQTDSAGFIMPAISAITADMEHLLHNFTPNRPYKPNKPN